MQRTRTSPSSSPTSDSPKVYVGKAALLQRGARSVKGKLVTLGGEQGYQISNYDQIPPFLVSLVSPGDHWMYLSSTGALTAGRKSPEHALFPYVTEDKLHDAAPHTGPKTIVLIERQNETLLWEPFANRYDGIYRVTRNLYKNATGNKLTFVEINHDLSLHFQYSWQFSLTYGFIRKVHLESLWKYPIRMRVLDGLQNLLPSGLPSTLQDTRSSLVDAYKISELERGIGLYRLNSLIVDRPEPAEALTATTVWTLGPSSRINLSPRTILLSSHQLPLFSTRRCDPK